MRFTFKFQMPTIPEILQLPDLRLRKPYTILPRPNAIDQWLLANHIDFMNDIFNNPYWYMGDIPSDQVLCTLQLSAIKVKYHSEPSLKSAQ